MTGREPVTKTITVRFADENAQPDRLHVRTGSTTAHFDAGLCGRVRDRCDRILHSLRCCRDAGHDGDCTFFEIRSS